MKKETKKSKKAIKVIGIILAVIIVFTAIFTIVSHAVWHRSDMATIVELYFRISGTKNKFANPDECESYIEQRRTAGEYRLDTSTVKSDVTETTVNGNRVYTLTASNTPERLVLYLHGGAYINEASIYHWRFCDKLVQEANAEVVFPIYPLTPNHTWSETFDMITKI